MNLESLTRQRGSTLKARVEHQGGPDNEVCLGGKAAKVTCCTYPLGKFKEYSMAIPDFIDVALESNAQECRLHFGARSIAAYYRDFRTIDSAFECIERQWATLHKNNFRLFVGGSLIDETYVTDNAVLAASAISPVDIVELARVGTHNNDGGYWEVVSKAMQIVYDVCPFEPYFADAAGYKARFLKQPDESEARKIFDTIMKIAPESWQLLYEEAKDNGFQSENSSAQEYERGMLYCLTNTGRFHLWWD